jgi:hypothetical protein
VDLTPFAGASGLIAVRVREREVGGGTPGVVVRYVLELEWANGESTLVEETAPTGQAFNQASFEAAIDALNRELTRRRQQRRST